MHVNVYILWQISQYIFKYVYYITYTYICTYIYTRILYIMFLSVEKPCRWTTARAYFEVTSTTVSPQVNLFFLLNIVRVLITKLKVTHQAESSLYMKAVRATLILVPLLGIQYVLLPYKPGGRVSSEIYDYIMHILMHYQVGKGNMFFFLFCVIFPSFIHSFSFVYFHFSAVFSFCVLESFPFFLHLLLNSF